MPVAGRPRNPLAELPLRFRRGAHVSVAVLGQTPGLMEYDRHTDVQAAGTIRRYWRQLAGLIPAPPEFSWSGNRPAFSGERAYGWTRALRYKITSLYLPAGAGNTRYGAARPHVAMANAQPAVTLGAGTRQARPTVRNRLRSFGSRVTPLNSPIQAAQDAQVGP